MKKRLVFLLLAIIMIAQTQAVFAGSVETTTKAVNSTTMSQDVELLGNVQTATLFSAVVPTTVNFVVDTKETGWNKVLSPDFHVQSLTTAILKVEIDSATVNTPGVSFISSDYFSYGKEVRLAVAPKSSYSNWNSVLNYALYEDDYWSNHYPISLTPNLSSNGIATYNLYGDVSSSFAHDESFSIKTVFKVSIV